MHPHSPVRLLLISCLALFWGCTRSSPPVNLEEYNKEMDAWRQHRLERLKSESGWLTVVNLAWLKEGENSLGSDSTCDVLLPNPKVPAKAGAIFLEHGGLRIAARPDAGLTIADSAVTSRVLESDGEGTSDPTLLRIGPVQFYVIKRGEQYGVRVKDAESAVRLQFTGLDYFPVDVRWRVEARFEPYTPPKSIAIATVINTVENDSCPGALVFAIDGTEYRLDAVVEKGSEEQLFIMFSDETRGKETYGLGRQVYANLPDAGNRTILDFNKAYNWPCVFTDFATCPIPPRQNHLPIRVEAGEKMYWSPLVKGHRE